MHVELKTWRDLIYGQRALDVVEDLLSRQLKKFPKAQLRLIVQGAALSSPTGTTVFRANRGGNKVFTPVREIKREGAEIRTNSLNMIYSWLYQIGKFCEVYPTFSYTVTAQAISSFYRADQKPEKEHTTFHRYLKTIEWNPNPQVQKLMAIADGIGSVKAVALLKEFGVLWNILKAEPSDLQRVPGIGQKLARDILRRIGRPDIE